MTSILNITDHISVSMEIFNCDIATILFYMTNRTAEDNFFYINDLVIHVTFKKMGKLFIHKPSLFLQQLNMFIFV